MSKSNPGKRKVVVTTNSDKPTPTQSKAKSSGTSSGRDSGESNLIFNKQNYLWFGIGFLLIVVGMALMTGGAMPSPDVWDESLIYSARRTVIAPIVILAGLVVEVYAIFKS